MKKSIISFLLGLLIIVAYSNIALAQEVSLDLSPNRVDIGLNFNGAELVVSGKLPAGSDVYIKVASPGDSVLKLNKKGKIGIFWLNVESTRVTNVPKLYQIIASKPLRMLPVNLRQELGLNPDFLQIYRKAIVIKEAEKGSVQLPKKDAGEYITTLIDTYKQYGLYVVKENSVKIEGNKYKTSIKLPANIPQEETSVTVYAIKGGKLVSSQSTSFKVSSVGVVRWLNKMAIYDGPSFGLIAIITALAFGVGIALLFNYIENAFSSSKNTGFKPGGSH